MPFLSQTADLLAFAATYSLVVAMPGPNLFVVARASLSARRHAGVAAALGVAAGAGLLALLSLTLSTVVAGGSAARLAAHVVFACLLIAMGWRAVASALRPVGAAAPHWDRAAGTAAIFGLGFATAASNPMSAVFFGTYLLSGGWTGEAPLAAPEAALVVFCVAFLWFALVGAALSTSRFRSVYAAQVRRVDGILGIGLCGLGLAVLLRLAEG